MDDEEPRGDFVNFCFNYTKAYRVARAAGKIIFGKNNTFSVNLYNTDHIGSLGYSYSDLKVSFDIFEIEVHFLAVEKNTRCGKTQFSPL